MTRLRDFQKLGSGRHNPAVGIEFGESNLRRLLIIGLSHYDSDANKIRRPEYTHNLIHEVIKGDPRIPYFTKVARLFRNADGELYSPQDFYPLVAFYNYLPDHFRNPKQRFSDDLYSKESTEEFFYVVLRELKPTHVLVTGKSLWRMLPSRTKLKPAAEIELPLKGNLHEDERHAWWYPTTGNDYALVAGIYHPSSSSFNADEIRQWIPQFLNRSQADGHN